MGRKATINKHIEKILRLCKNTQNLTEIGRHIGVSATTIQRWRDKGQNDADGPYRQFYEALTASEKSEHEQEHAPPDYYPIEKKEHEDDNLTDDLRMERTIKQSATRRTATRQYKRKWTSPDGVRHEETVIEKAPDANMALKALERLKPLEWGAMYIQRLEIATDGKDWERTVREQGGDPREIEELVRKALGWDTPDHQPRF